MTVPIRDYYSHTFEPNAIRKSVEYNTIREGNSLAIQLFVLLFVIPRPNPCHGSQRVIVLRSTV
jgi:hypothetical protein